VSVRALRGAIQIDADQRDLILRGVQEMITQLFTRNAVDADDVISIIFTATPDLRAEFPAYAARLLGFTDIPLLCAREIDVPDAMPRVLRVLAHVETTRTRAEMHHVYLGGAAALRRDLPS
jgi:chorismate mutase